VAATPTAGPRPSSDACIFRSGSLTPVGRRCPRASAQPPLQQATILWADQTASFLLPVQCTLLSMVCAREICSVRGSRKLLGKKFANSEFEILAKF
jgi:hypothetical protein